jgi:hypothetical protein
MSRRDTIGFDRDIELEWLDFTAQRTLEGLASEEVRRSLWQLLEGKVAGDKPRSGRGKTVTVLTHVWLDVPDEMRGLRNRALAELRDALPAERLALHWAMVVATYPFFGDVAAAVGRLLALQGNASLAQVNRRLIERWGERSTMIRAVRRSVRSMVRWGALRDSAKHGTYEPVSPRLPIRAAVSGVLVEGVAAGLRETLPATQLLSHPCLFPFDVGISAPALRSLPTLQTRREGLDADLVKWAGKV